MIPKEENKPSFWNTRKGILFQIVIVLLPSILLLRSGTLLLAGLACSVLLAWGGLRLRGLNWSDVGLKAPSSLIKIITIAIVAVTILIPLTYVMRDVVTSITHEPPNLQAFRFIEGNPKALLVGLVVVWLFGAFAEEMLFRGFLMNSFHKLFETTPMKEPMTSGLSLVITSVLVSFGHMYQGITGMILTGIVGFCFGLIYLNSKRNLWPSILTHGLYDTVAFIFLFFGFSLDQLFK